jgi:hypothetical protein
MRLIIVWVLTIWIGSGLYAFTANQKSAIYKAYKSPIFNGQTKVAFQTSVAKSIIITITITATNIPIIGSPTLTPTITSTSTPTLDKIQQTQALAGK